MAVTGRWPRAIFYDSKTTLFDWAWTWREAARQLVEKYDAPIGVDEFLETWVTLFEAFHRRSAFADYTPVTETIRKALLTLYRIHDIPGDGDDVRAYTDLQRDVKLFPEVEEALQAQQDRGVKVLIYSDVEKEFLDMYISKFQRFTPDFVATTDIPRIHKPNPRTYDWVLRQTGLAPRDVIYCAAPMFDIQGAMGSGLISAWLRRREGRLSKETHQAVGLPADYEVEDLHDLTAIIDANRGG